MITAKEIIKQINSALKEFGSYSYNDKGAREVMDLNSIANELKSMTPAEVVKVLEEVNTKHKNPHPFISDILGYFDTWNHPDANILFDSELFQKNY